MIPRVFYIVGIKYHKTKVINLQSIITLSRVYQVDFTLFLRKKSNYLHVHNNTNFSKYGNEFLFYELYNDTIYTLTSTNCIPRYYLNFGASRIPNSYFEKDYKKHHGIPRNEIESKMFFRMV